jgi:hypothetical protein
MDLPSVIPNTKVFIPVKEDDIRFAHRLGTCRWLITAASKPDMLVFLTIQIAQCSPQRIHPRLYILLTIVLDWVGETCIFCFPDFFSLPNSREGKNQLQRVNEMQEKGDQ